MRTRLRRKEYTRYFRLLQWKASQHQSPRRTQYTGMHLLNLQNQVGIPGMKSAPLQQRKSRFHTAHKL